MYMDKGMIILLNGVSSAGKTSLAKVLQDHLDEPYYLLGTDMFQCDMLPQKFTNHTNANYNHATHLRLYLNAMSGFHRTIKVFSDMGLPTIVDHVFLEGHKTFDDFINVLSEYPVCLVSVTCPMEELRRREKERGDRFIGQAEEQLSQLYPQDTYDIIVDTFANTLDECATKIMELLHCPDKMMAFKTLLK